MRIIVNQAIVSLSCIVGLAGCASVDDGDGASQAVTLARDPVAYVYNMDHALSLANNHVTDDDFTARTVKLASSPWGFYRGTSPLFYRDLGELPASAYATGANDVWLMGDAHLENF